MSLTTERLRVRPLTFADAPFIVVLLNDPEFIRNIGDRGVRSEDDAHAYLAAGPMASYERHGFGLCAVELIDGREPVGICGLLQRDELPAPDIGFAFLPGHRSRGYAFEAARAVLADGAARLRIQRVLAIVNPDNVPSIRLLERLGFTFERMVAMTPGARELKLFASDNILRS